MSQKDNQINLAEIIGSGYGEFWRSRKRFVVCKGSRGSKKSKTTALWTIFHMMKYDQMNALYVRKTERSLLNSCYSDCLWAINRLGVSEFWKATKNPLEIVYIPTGQRILFRGLDDPFKITSISVPKGVLNIVNIEEAYEISNPEHFYTLNESIRGELPEGYFVRCNIIFNPWSSSSWLKKEFFDEPRDDTYAFTTTYRCNEYLTDGDRAVFDQMKIRNPRRWKVAANGEWGIDGETIFENWEECSFSLEDVKNIKGIKETVGLDFGFVDPSVLLHVFVSNVTKEVYIWDEWYQPKATNQDRYNAAVQMGLKYLPIYCDSANPKDRLALYEMGLVKIQPARKGNDSVLHGIRQLQECKIYVHPRCVNTITELSLYAWQKDKNGNNIDKPEGGQDHCCDCLRYSTGTVLRGSLFSFD